MHKKNIAYIIMSLSINLNACTQETVNKFYTENRQAIINKFSTEHPNFLKPNALTANPDSFGRIGQNLRVSVFVSLCLNESDEQIQKHTLFIKETDQDGSVVEEFLLGNLFVICTLPFKPIQTTQNVQDTWNNALSAGSGF